MYDFCWLWVVSVYRTRSSGSNPPSMCKTSLAGWCWCCNGLFTHQYPIISTDHGQKDRDRVMIKFVSCRIWVIGNMSRLWISEYYKKTISAGEFAVVNLSVPLSPINLQYPFKEALRFKVLFLFFYIKNVAKVKKVIKVSKLTLTITYCITRLLLLICASSILLLELYI